MDLKRMTVEELYEQLSATDRVRAREGRGRTPEAAHVRAWCKTQKRRIRAELGRRRLPAPPDGRWTGIGRGFFAGEVGP